MIATNLLWIMLPPNSSILVFHMGRWWSNLWTGIAKMNPPSLLCGYPSFLSVTRAAVIVPPVSWPMIYYLNHWYSISYFIVKKSFSQVITIWSIRSFCFILFEWFHNYWYTTFTDELTIHLMACPWVYMRTWHLQLELKVNVGLHWGKFF